MKYYLIVLLCAMSLISQGQQMYFPQRAATWEELKPEEAVAHPEAIEQAVAFAKANEYSGSKDLRIAILEGFKREPYHQILGPTKKRGGPAGMILKDGKIVAQWGDTRRVDMTFSVTKSFLATTAGLALDQRLIRSAEDLVGSYVWDGTFDGRHNSSIQWKHLLQQNSAWQGSLFGGKDWADRPPSEGDVDDWQYAAPKTPGSVMEYNDVRVNVLAYALTHTWRRPLPEVLKNHIMDPIGASTTWRWFGYEDAWTVIDGIKMKSVTGGGHSGAGIFINTQDMARFGLLYLNDGVWDGKRLLSSAWIKEATTASEPNPNYGYMWWLNNKGPRHWEGVDTSVYYAAGFGGNFIIVDKKHRMVIVTRWLEPSQIGTFMALLQKAF